jgi:hypothetical protein
VNAPGVIGNEEEDLEDLEEQDEGLGVRLKKHMEMLY